MGMHPSLYVGPYVECTVIKKIVHVQVDACTNTNCPKPKPKDTWDKVKVKFCGTCGTVVGPISIGVLTAPNYFQLLPDDVLTLLVSDPEGTMWLGSNLTRGVDRKLHLDADMEQHVDLGAIDRDAEVKWFSTRYEKEIKILTEAYANVTVKWGLHYWHH